MTRNETLEYFKDIFSKKEMHELIVWIKAHEYKSKLFRIKNKFKIVRQPCINIVYYYIFFGDFYLADGKHIKFIA